MNKSPEKSGLLHVKADVKQQSVKAFVETLL
jgi:hypothetical protein